MEMRNKVASRENRASQPDEDVDTAFNFLETYDNYGYKDE